MQNSFGFRVYWKTEDSASVVSACGFSFGSRRCVCWVLLVGLKNVLCQNTRTQIERMSRKHTRLVLLSVHLNSLEDEVR